ncbi:hypothetical protein TCAL_02680, partial [Tigriopus californicus]
SSAPPTNATLSSIPNLYNHQRWLSWFLVVEWIENSSLPEEANKGALLRSTVMLCSDVSSWRSILGPIPGQEQADLCPILQEKKTRRSGDLNALDYT